MPTLHIPLLIVLLLIPNTTWRDWHAPCSAPESTALQMQIAQLLFTPTGRCSLAVMNARTADLDKITPLGGGRTLLAGARLRSDASEVASESGLGYTALAENLPQSLVFVGIGSQGIDPPSRALIDSRYTTPERRGKFVVETLVADDPQSVALIRYWRDKVAAAGSRGALIVASPNPSLAEYRAQDQLTPILFWRPVDTPGSNTLLYSPSTRTEGLIANTDVAPTIADLAGTRLIGPAFGSACIAQAATGQDAAEALSRLTSDASVQSRRQKAVPWLAGCLAVLIAAASVITAVRPSGASGRIASCAAATFPLILIIVHTWQEAAAACAGVCFLACLLPRIGGALHKRRQSMYAVAERGMRGLVLGGSAGALGFIAGDTLLNHGHAVAGSLLGYSPLEGARYYGLGNEAMGIVAGAVTVICGRILAGRWMRQGAATVAIGSVLWCAFGILLAAPELGAKAGAIPVFGVGLVSFWLAELRATDRSDSNAAPGRATLRPEMGRWNGAIAAGVTLFAAAAAMIRLLRRHSGNTHVTLLIDQARQFGPGVYAQLALRKLGMDAHLVLHSVWMLVLIAAVGGIWLNARAALRSGLLSPSRIAVAAAVIVACLVFNDAGVVAAALCACAVWSEFLLQRSSEINSAIEV